MSLRLVVKGLEPLLMDPGVFGGVQTTIESQLRDLGSPLVLLPFDSVAGRICRNTAGRPLFATEGRQAVGGALTLRRRARRHPQ